MCLIEHCLILQKSLFHPVNHIKVIILWSQKNQGSKRGNWLSMNRCIDFVMQYNYSTTLSSCAISQLNPCRPTNHSGQRLSVSLYSPNLNCNIYWIYICEKYLLISICAISRHRVFFHYIEQNMHRKFNLCLLFILLWYCLGVAKNSTLYLNCIDITKYKM